MKPHPRILSEEYYAVFLSFLYFFCVLAAYYVLRPMRDQLAVEVGSSNLPLFFGATFLTTLIVTPTFSWLVSRWPRALLMPFVYLFFITCQLLFIPLFNNHDLLPIRTLGLLFFVYVSVFNLFVVSVFWSFMTDIWDDMQARRLFPIIALGGTAGAVSGPLITSVLVKANGLSFLLVVSSTLLLGAVGCIIGLGCWASQYGVHRNEAGNAAAIKGSMLDGLKQIFTNPFIGTMAVMMLLSDAIGTIAYVLVTDYSGIAFPNDVIAQTRFAAHMDLAANVMQVVVQLTVTRWLLVRYGAGVVFLVCSAIVVVTCLMMAFSNDPYMPWIATMPPIAIVMIVTRSLSHSMIQPARETLYTLVSRTLKYKGKNAVDTVVWRAGDILSILSIKGFRSLGVHVAGFGFIWAALAALSGFIGWRLAKRVEKGDLRNI